VAAPLPPAAVTGFSLRVPVREFGPALPPAAVRSVPPGPLWAAFAGLVARTPPTGVGPSLAPDELFRRDWFARPHLSPARTRRLLEGIAALGPVVRRAGRRVRDIPPEHRRRFERLRRRVAAGHLRLVGFWVNRTHPVGLPGLPWEDLMQAGVFGLLRAAELFDPGRGAAFSTYAVPWVRHMIDRATQTTGRLIRIPTHQQTGPDRLPAAELARLARPLPVPLTLLPDPRCPDPAQALEADDAAAARVGVVREMLRALPAREAHVLVCRFGLAGNPEETLQQLGERLGLTRERVRQLERKALDKLASPRHRAAADGVL
jgi:RNA polymerase sigma factor (sigma-70 family)